MAKHSAHFINALKREKERLQKKHDAVSKKIGNLVDEQNTYMEHMRDIDRQLSEEPELGEGEEASNVAQAA